MPRLSLHPCVVLFLATACGQSAERKGTSKVEKPAADAASEPSAEEPEANGKTGPSPYDGFDAQPEELTGTWATPSGHFRYFHFEGDGVRWYDAMQDVEKTGTFELGGPCALVLRDGSGWEMSLNYAFDGDTLYAGTNVVGLKQGDAVLGCFKSGEAFVYRDGACQRWKRTPISPTRERGEGTCKLEEKGGKTTFPYVDRPNDPVDYRLELKGERAMVDEFAEAFRKVASLEKAREVGNVKLK